MVDGVSRNYIARLNLGGALDTSFNPDAINPGATNSWVESIAIQKDKKILVRVQPPIVGGTTKTYLARLNPDGSLDTNFAPDVGPVFSLAVQADDKILISGIISERGGIGYISRLNPDGSLDADFNSNTDYPVSSLALQADGRILIGGDFTSVGGVTRNYLARLNPDGSLDTDFTPDVGPVLSLAVQADDKILIRAYVDIRSMITQVIRLNPDGSLDAGFEPHTVPSVNSFALQADGKILIGGDFTLVDGVAKNRMARLNPDGSLDADFDPNADGPIHSNPSVYSIAVQPDGKILMGGGFTTVGGVTRIHIARITNTDAALQELLVSANGSTVTWMRGQTSPEVGRVTFEDSSDGVTWSPLGNGARITGGWQLAGLSLPFNQNHYVRARGYASGGSGSLSESVRMLYLKHMRPAVDFDGDAKTDLLWQHASGTLGFWFMNGATISSVQVAGGSTWEIAATRDFDADGKADVLWRDPVSGTVAIWFMNGTGVSSVGVSGAVPVDWQIKGAGDFSGDGKADILWYHPSSGTTVIWFMNGTTISSMAIPGTVPSSWEIKGVGDIDADGKADIVWQHTTGTVAIWLMNGGAISSVAVPGVVPSAWEVKGVGDFNGDAKADILWYHTASGTTAIWFMNGGTISSVAVPGAVPSGWQIETVGDVDGNGKEDIIWQHTTGTVAVWLMNGPTIYSVGVPGTVTSDWQIMNK
jgi:uncharacterized delta-60 repeat protein